MTLIFDPYRPAYNTIIVFVILTIIVLIIKPTFMYDYENKKLKQFGCGQDQTLLSFPLFSISCAIIIYIIFSSIEIIYNIIDNKSIPVVQVVPLS